jgi:hypothetical protein
VAIAVTPWSGATIANPVEREVDNVTSFQPPRWCGEGHGGHEDLKIISWAALVMGEGEVAKVMPKYAGGFVREMSRMLNLKN